MTDNMSVTYDGVDLTEYVNRPEVQQAIADSGKSLAELAMKKFVWLLSVRLLTEDELAEIGQLYAEGRALDELAERDADAI